MIGMPVIENFKVEMKKATEIQSPFSCKKW